MLPVGPALRSRWTALRSAVSGPRAEAAAEPVAARRGQQICLGLAWLLDAALQFQPFMFGRAFPTQVIQPTTAGNPAVVASSVTWASQLMLHDIAACNAAFAAIQLLIAAGFFFRRTIKAALAASVVWALLVWWFGESLGGILTGASPFAGLPGGVVLYALIALLLWPSARAARARAPSARAPSARAPLARAAPARAAPGPPICPAAAGPLGYVVARLLWLVLWGSFARYLLIPANRAPDAISQVFAGTDGQPGWIASIMNDASRLAAQRGTQISVVVAIACVLVALGVFVPPLVRPALVLAAALGLLFWIGEGLGGVFTGQGTDPNTGPLLVLLAACFWPAPGAGGVSSSGGPAAPADRPGPTSAWPGSRA